MKHESSTALTNSKPAGRPEMVFLGIPCSGGQVDSGTAEAILRAPRSVRCAPVFQSFSLLAANFNFLFCAALNLRHKGFTHFCMLHSDVIPQGMDWLGQMLGIMNARQLGALSAVIPIKDERGLTSTGMDYSTLPDVNPYAVRRLTMHEVMELPETFNADDAADGLPGFPDGIDPVLLINTGLLLIDIRQKWTEQVCFTVDDRIRRNPATGEFESFTDPEDWNFSRQMHRLGVRYAATRRIPVEHAGRATRTNTVAWGRCETDPAFRHEPVEPATVEA